MLGWSRMTRLRFIIFQHSIVTEHVFSRMPVRLGRHPENECQIIDSQISRQHALLRYREGELSIRNIGARNKDVHPDGPWAKGPLVRAGIHDQARRAHALLRRCSSARANGERRGHRLARRRGPGRARRCTRPSEHVLRYVEPKPQHFVRRHRSTRAARRRDSFEHGDPPARAPARRRNERCDGPRGTRGDERCPSV